MKKSVKYLIVGCGIVAFFIIAIFALFAFENWKYRKALDIYVNADAYQNSGNYDKAIDEYKKGLRYADRSLSVKFESELASAYYSKHDYVNAKKYVQNVLRVRKNNLKCLSLLGLIEFKTGNIDQAEKMFIDIVKQHPNNHAVYLQLAYIHNESKNFDKAIDYCERAIKIANSYLGIPAEVRVGPTKYLGIIYVGMGDYAKAIKYFNDALNIYPKDKEIYGLIAKAYEYKKDSKSAAEYWNKVIKLYDASDGRAKFAHFRLDEIAKGNFLAVELGNTSEEVMPRSR